MRLETDAEIKSSKIEEVLKEEQIGGEIQIVVSPGKRGLREDILL